MFYKTLLSVVVSLVLLLFVVPITVHDIRARPVGTLSIICAVKNYIL